MRRGELGEFRRTFTTDWAKLMGAAGLVAGFVVGWTVLVLLGLITPVQYLMGLILLKFVVVLNLLPLLGRAVQVYERGLVVHGVLSRTVVAWTELEAVYLVVRPRWTALPGELLTCRELRLATGDTFALVGEENGGYEVILSRALAEVTANVAGKLFSAFDQGKAVRFGPLRVERDGGLAVAGRTWAWTELEALRYRWGAIELPGGPRVPLGLVPNPHLLLRLVEQQGVDAHELREALGSAAE